MTRADRIVLCIYDDETDEYFPVDVGHISLGYELPTVAESIQPCWQHRNPPSHIDIKLNRLGYCASWPTKKMKPITLDKLDLRDGSQGVRAAFNSGRTVWAIKMRETIR
jgi:hypothetical protein